MKNKKHRKRRVVPYFKRHLGSNEARYRTRLIHHWEKIRIEKPSVWWKTLKLWQKYVTVFVCVLLVSFGSMYGIAQWYILRHSKEQTQLGTTFIPSYATYLGVDPQETFHALIYDAGFRHFRLVSYWEDIEQTPGQYDFSQLDWQFRMAEATNTKISLAIGLRQPRWPECHIPTWAKDLPTQERDISLLTFMGKVIQRYKDSPALQTYQLENEFFLKAFGECTDFNRDRLVEEFNYVKAADPNHKIIISRSNNALGLPIGQPTPDQFGVSVYKRVWDKTITHRYFEYPFPAWYYAFFAGAGELLTGKDMIIHELQAEPWLPEGYDLRTASTEEQYKSMNAERLRDRIKFGEATGMKTIDLWGSEWWYARKVNNNDPSLWNVAKDEVQKVQRTNAY